MDYYTNHCWCSQSNWDNDFFHCQHLVTIDEKVDGDDYDKLVGTLKLPDEERYKLHLNAIKDIPELSGVLNQGHFTKPTKSLKYEVYKWLLENVEDLKDGKAWCVGNLEYCSSSYAKNYTIFFKRRKDAFAFVKRWSKYKKFTSEFNYFKDKGKNLNLKTMKYTHWER